MQRGGLIDEIVANLNDGEFSACDEWSNCPGFFTGQSNEPHLAALLQCPQPIQWASIENMFIIFFTNQALAASIVIAGSGVYIVNSYLRAYTESPK